ncbi:MAG: hypothetical protein ABW022_20240 [Actinoplanes sp.]
MSLNIIGVTADAWTVAEILTPEEAEADESIIDHPPGMYAIAIGDSDNQMIITGSLDQLREIIGKLARYHNQLSGRSHG